MAERLDYEQDVDPNQQWYHWGDLIMRDHLTIPGILKGLPAATTPEDHTLRTLAISRWLTRSDIGGGGLHIGFDEEGVVAQCPHRQPLLMVSLKLEDMSTRPETISRSEVALATTQPVVANQLVGQWLPFSEEINIDDIMDAHHERMNYWDDQIHQQEIRWFSKDTSFVMGVVMIEAKDGASLGVFDCMTEILNMTAQQKNYLFSRRMEYCSPIWKAIEEIDPYIAMEDISSELLYFAGPSAARVATMQARRLEAQFPPPKMQARSTRL